MSVSPQKAPYGLDLDPGTYYWCALWPVAQSAVLRRIASGHGFAPVQFTVDERKKLWLCGCKQTGTAPYCDGTHKSL
jgi:CDGSH iron-sulfur domain-containing protein 3